VTSTAIAVAAAKRYVMAGLVPAIDVFLRYGRRVEPAASVGMSSPNFSAGKTLNESDVP
jgi:hypothetical protein